MTEEQTIKTTSSNNKFFIPILMNKEKKKTNNVSNKKIEYLQILILKNEYEKLNDFFKISHANGKLRDYLILIFKNDPDCLIRCLKRNHLNTFYLFYHAMRIHFSENSTIRHLENSIKYFIEKNNLSCGLKPPLIRLFNIITKEFSSEKIDTDSLLMTAVTSNNIDALCYMINALSFDMRLYSNNDAKDILAFAIQVGNYECVEVLINECNHCLYQSHVDEALALYSKTLRENYFNIFNLLNDYEFDDEYDAFCYGIRTN